jgi:hypothetical protein
VINLSAPEEDDIEEELRREFINVADGEKIVKNDHFVADGKSRRFAFFWVEF